MTVLVNKEKIKDDEIQQEFDRLLPYYNQHVRTQDPKASDKQLYDWAKENLIERVLMKQEAMKDIEKVPDKEVRKVWKDIKDNYEKVNLNDLRSDIELQIKYERLVKRLQNKAEKPAESEIKEYYEKNKDKYTIPEQIHAAHIVKHINAELDKKTAEKAIKKVDKELKKGKSFEEIANKNSDCPDNAGDLGFFPRGQMVQEFEDVVFKMKPDEISKPFLSPFGYHIVKLYEKVPSRVVPFEEVQDKIKEEMVKINGSEEVELFVDKLKETAQIEEIKEEKKK